MVTAVECFTPLGDLKHPPMQTHRQSTSLRVLRPDTLGGLSPCSHKHIAVPVVTKEPLQVGVPARRLYRETPDETAVSVHLIR